MRCVVKEFFLIIVLRRLMEPRGAYGELLPVYLMWKNSLPQHRVEIQKPLISIPSWMILSDTINFISWAAVQAGRISADCSTITSAVFICMNRTVMMRQRLMCGGSAIKIYSWKR